MDKPILTSILLLIFYIYSGNPLDKPRTFLGTVSYYAVLYILNNAEGFFFRDVSFVISLSRMNGFHNYFV